MTNNCANTECKAHIHCGGVCNTYKPPITVADKLFEMVRALVNTDNGCKYCEYLSLSEYCDLYQQNITNLKRLQACLDIFGGGE
jgi:hypothetical protein